MNKYQEGAAEELLEQIEHRAQAEAEAISHRQPMTSSARSQSATTLKYYEGQIAAVERLRRLMGEESQVSPAVRERLLREEAAQWRKMLLHHCDGGAPALPWLAYSRGGLDAVEAVNGWPAANGVNGSRMNG